MVTDMLNLSSKGLSIHTAPETPRLNLSTLEWAVCKLVTY